jgi:HEPN domain-containing protein
MDKDLTPDGDLSGLRLGDCRLRGLAGRRAVESNCGIFVGSGASAVNRADLRRLAEDRVLDAAALLKEGRWSGAYYLAGYAVECGLKACVLAYVERTGVIFQDKKFLEKCWTHDPEALIKAADLDVTLGLDISANSQLGTNWLVVKDWSELARYQLFTELQARTLFEAVTETANGVLPWVRLRW